MPKSNPATVVFKVSGTEAITVSGGKIESTIVRGRGRYAAAIDGVESLILALSAAGANLDTPLFHQAVKQAVEAVANNHA